MVEGGGLFWARLVVFGSIGEDERVLSFFMLEKVTYPLVFHQARNKIEVGFPVLDAIFPLFVSSVKRYPVIQKSFL